MVNKYLPLNITPTLSNYKGYVNVYELNKTTYVFGSGWPLKTNAAGNSLTANYLNNTIQFTPMVVNDSNSFWFVSPLYTPNKWIVNELYQETTLDMNNNNIFTGSFRSNTLYTKYAQTSNYNYTVNAFIKAYNSNFSSLLAIATSTINQTGNFYITLDTTTLTNIGHLQWGFTMNGYPVYPTEAGNQGSVIIGDAYPCFKENSKILTNKGYVSIQDLHKGDFVKTLKHGYLPIDMIGKKEIVHIASKDRVQHQLYQYSKDEYPEILEPLVLTGCHSILVDWLTEDQGEKTMKEFGRIFETDGKPRLMTFLNEKAIVYETPGTYTIYHLALENENYYGNYGIYANGLLVESCSKRYLKELFDTEIIHV